MVEDNEGIMVLETIADLEGGGRLAPRLIQDWFAGVFLEHADLDIRNKFVCTNLRLPNYPVPRDASAGHDLLMIGSQSCLDNGNDPDKPDYFVVSCMCRYCRYHFVFEGQRDPSSRIPEDHLEHHLRFGHMSAKKIRSPFDGQEREGWQIEHNCICTLGLKVRITPPHLKPEWVALLSDEDRVRRNILSARRADPERFKDFTPEKINQYAKGALYTLNQYLRNVVSDDQTKERKRISFRNKTFSVQFGASCEAIFRYLGFSVVAGEALGEEEERYWVPPRLPSAAGNTPLAAGQTPLTAGKTPLNSQRALYEDVRSEVQSLLDANPSFYDGRTQQPLVKAISAQPHLEKALRVNPANTIGRSNISGSSISSAELTAFQLLGAPLEATDELLQYAFLCQRDSCCQRAGRKLCSVLGLLAERRSVELQQFVFANLPPDEQPVAKGPFHDAYAYFNASDSKDLPPQHYIALYRTRREQAPVQKASHRRQLRQIGIHRNSSAILEVALAEEDMDIDEACSLLEVDKRWPLESCTQVASSMSEQLGDELTFHAFNVLLRSRDAQESGRDEAEALLASLKHKATKPADPVADAEAMDVDPPKPSGARTPPGLENLRNTCYLNSILQYFFTVNAVRDIVTANPLNTHDPSDEWVVNVLTQGGSVPPKIDPGSAFVGLKFSRELGGLFKILQSTDKTCVRPEQRLANAALLKPEKLRDTREARAKPTSELGPIGPPALPPRGRTPSRDFAVVEHGDSYVPAGNKSTRRGAFSRASTTAEQPEPAEVDRSETASAVSSTQTLVDAQEGQSAAPADLGKGKDAEASRSKPSIKELMEELNAGHVGSDQMDVDEVMGNAINHLQAACQLWHISSNGNTSDQEKKDPIQDAFFSTFVDNRKKIGDSTWTRSVRVDRWVTAYPAESGSRSLYDALANSFDLEVVSDRLSFATIERPAPYFHIFIQRAQRSDDEQKNSNPIIIPDTLYLDRFMHLDTSSPSFREKKHGWDVRARLNELTAATESEAETDAETREVDGFLMIDNVGAGLPENLSAAGGDSDAEYTIIDRDTDLLFNKYGVTRRVEGQRTPSRTSPRPVGSKPVLTSSIPPPSQLDDFWQRFHAGEQKEKEDLKTQLAASLSDKKQMAYRLHAVICHMGTSSSGHYWVWIYDFEQNVWNKYNDERVSTHSAEEVFKELNTTGKPYYLAYVQADRTRELVSIPKTRSREEMEGGDTEMEHNEDGPTKPKKPKTEDRSA